MPVRDGGISEFPKRRSMKKNMHPVYKPAANISDEERQRRLDAAFDILFEEVFAAKKSNEDRQFETYLTQSSPAEVFSHDR